MPFIQSLGDSGHIEMNEEDQVMMAGLKMLGDLGNSAELQNAAAVVVELAATPEYRLWRASNAIFSVQDQKISKVKRRCLEKYSGRSTKAIRP